MEKRLIVIVAMPDALTLDIIGPADVFTGANHFLPPEINREIEYEVLTVSATEDLEISTRSGIVIRSKSSIYQVSQKIDTLLIAGFPSHREWKRYPKLVEWIRLHAPEIRRVGSVCIGAFVLAEAGLLRNRRATTHWMNCQELHNSYEEINVNADPIFVKDGNIYTSAGASAGIDLALALVEEDQGPEVALTIARYLVLYLRRPGNQSQFSNLLSQQLSSKKPIRDLQLWIADHLREDLNVEGLSGRLAMSPRNFARVFRLETGFTPARYIEKLRVESGRRFLEETGLSLEEIAGKCGFGSADTMRRAFLRHLDTSPSYYRNLFGAT
ncbi:GlxA family transcriptional regulator [Pedobacter caeni]|uniref:Transcriptional regulator, AraC family with amidase-like domain n=1 Tax=Pedobacter caeni TaxID=288992 RepID=A0A1M5ALA1_9SPHI|nr:helix-turn-helix domain-containing protein [Pedobacter caeni]SHF30945.1 transcriptional regulator, AraC family with amidase-like domain [Pedobacter caeni]